MAKRFLRGIWWIKRDFRLNDNQALCQAIAECEYVLPLFVLEPGLCSAEETSLLHYHAWQHAGQTLDSALQACENSLSLWAGEVCDVLDLLLANDGFDALYSHEETGSDITYARDKAVACWTIKHGVKWTEYPQSGVVRGLTDRDKRQPIIRQRLLQTSPLSAPSTIPAWTPKLTGSERVAGTDSLSLLDASNSPLPLKRWTSPAQFQQLQARHNGSVFTPALQPAPDCLQAVSERQAQKDLRSFLYSRGIAYSGGISSPNTAFDAGSRLSCHLAWGTISLRCVFHELMHRSEQLAGRQDSASIRWRKSLRAFQSRLYWRDHFVQRLESAPPMEFASINPAYRQISYQSDPYLLECWINGQTGLPLVDACMRCLASTGFLNFRMRAMLVSVGCFGLAQSWQSLQYPLARLFLDYEPGIHFSQIQMQAGIVGINTLRIYSPLKQLRDQDPEARFVKQWIPELREFDATEIALYEEQPLGNYPRPVADLKANTRLIRDQVYAIRKSDAGKNASAQVLKEHGSRLSGNDRNRNNSNSARKSKRKPAMSAKDNQLTLDLGE